MDEDSGYDLGFGYDLGEYRLEFLFSRQKADSERLLHKTSEVPNVHVGVDVEGDVTVSSYMLSINKDFSMSIGFTPYVGIGGGLVSINQGQIIVALDELEDAFDVELNADNQEALDGYNERVAAYQLKAGLTKSISQDTELYAEASYTKTSNYKTGTGGQEIKWNGLGMYTARAGLVYKF